MRSRAVRLTLCALVWFTLCASAFFIYSSEQRVFVRRAALGTFDVNARDAVDRLADMRAAEQAYVAEGQGVAFWMPKVSALSEAAANAVDRLRESAVSREALESLVQAANTITEFGNLDRRARDYIKSDQRLMAADVVFTEGGETAASAVRQVEAAAVAEHLAFDSFEAGRQLRELYAAAGAGILGALMVGLLAFGRVGVPTASAADASPTPAASTGAGLGLRDLGPSSELPREVAPILKVAAELCTEFGRIKDVDDLTRLLPRVAAVLDASGLVVWLGNTKGADLRPVIAHGYQAQTLARMTAIPRHADNAAAAAYRTGSLQIVLARPGTSSGAIVAPLLSPEGCIGALAAEIKGGGEAFDRVQALAALFAAQLTGVLAASTAASDRASEERVS